MGVHGDAVIARLNLDRQNGKRFCDATIKMEGEENIPINRLLASTLCGYFDRLFESNFQEKFTHEVVLSGPTGGEFDPDLIRMVVDFMHTEELEVTRENMLHLILAADYLMFENLKVVVVSYILNNIDVGTWLDVFQVASKLNLASVLDGCVEKFTSVMSELDISDLEKDGIEHIAKNTNISSLVKFKLVLSWVKSNQSERQSHFDSLIENIDFDNFVLSVKYLKENILNEAVVMQSNTALVKLSPLLIKLATLDGAVECTSSNKLITCSCSNKRAVIVYGGCQESQSMMFYCPTCKLWKERKQIISKDLNFVFSACASDIVGQDDMLFCVIGGIIPGDGYFGGSKAHASSALLVHNISKNVWARHNYVLDDYLCHSAAAVYNHTLFVFGGTNSVNERYAEGRYYTNNFVFRSTNAILAINLASMQKMQPPYYIPKLKQARSNHCVTVRSGTAYVLGGLYHSYEKDENGIAKQCKILRLKSCESIDLHSMRQSSMPDMSDSRSSFAAVIYDDCIVALGGHDEENAALSTVEKYSFATKAWTYMAPMKTARYGHYAFVSDDRMYVMGGSITKTVEVYDPESKSWSVHDKTNGSLFYSNCATIQT